MYTVPKTPVPGGLWSWGPETGTGDRGPAGDRVLLFSENTKCHHDRLWDRGGWVGRGVPWWVAEFRGWWWCGGGWSFGIPCQCQNHFAFAREERRWHSLDTRWCNEVYQKLKNVLGPGLQPATRRLFPQRTRIPYTWPLRFPFTLEEKKCLSH
jgi:hypothetical protein